MAQPNLPAVTAIVVAAGASRRMGFDKLSYRLPDGRTVLETSCAALAAHPAITQLVLVCGGNRAACEAIAAACPKPCAVVQGGATRADSVRNGLAAATGELVAIHDAARPFVSESVITATLTAAAETGAAAPAVPVKDTVKVADPSGRVLDTPDRATLYAVQTPQCFRRALYTQALAAVTGEKARLVTDDCSLFELAGLPVRLTEGDYANYKITTKEDLQKEKTMRIGHGYDVHRLVEDRKLIMGGVEIPYEKGLLGHSDADVLLHAVMDAVLGAAALGDIGQHFPDNDPAYKGADSLALTCHAPEHCRRLRSARGCRQRQGHDGGAPRLHRRGPRHCRPCGGADRVILSVSRQGRGIPGLYTCSNAYFDPERGLRCPCCPTRCSMPF